MRGLKKSNRAFRNFFKKTAHDTQKFFKKGGQGSQILHDASVGLRKTGNTLTKINQEAGKVLNSPLVGTIAAGLGPEGLAGLQALRGANQAVALSGSVATQGSGLTKQRNYKGSEGDVVNSVIERSYKIGETANKGQNIKFA